MIKVAADNKNAGFSQGVFPAVQPAKARGGDSWATISAWAWGASRVLDWMETEPAIDAKHVGVVGHSRGGKTALWTGATDKRFAMACSNESGCGGAKLNHIDLPKSEHIDFMIRVLHHWFCANYRKYGGKEMEMPFDQHEMLALIAPRLLCVGSATEDHWCGWATSGRTPRSRSRREASRITCARASTSSRPTTGTATWTSPTSTAGGALNAKSDHAIERSVMSRLRRLLPHQA